MSIDPFVIEANEQGASRKLGGRKLRPQSLKTQTLWMFRKLRPETYNESVCAADRFKTSCLPFVDTLLTWAKSAEEGREREKKNSPRW